MGVKGQLKTNVQWRFQWREGAACSSLVQQPMLAQKELRVGEEVVEVGSLFQERSFRRRQPDRLFRELVTSFKQQFQNDIFKSFFHKYLRIS